MISEKKLVSSHSSFWRNLMPMGDAFVRGMNVKLERILPPFVPSGRGDRNALISELSFRIYCESIVSGRPFDELRSKTEFVDGLSYDVSKYISRLENTVSVVLEMSLAEKDEAFILASRLDQFIRYTNPGKEIRPRPHFFGCGVVDDCEGDILAGDMLIELKNVERDFRIADLRQLLTYCALDFAAGSKGIKQVGLVNARSGQWYKIGLNDLSLAVSGVPSTDLISDLIRYITADAPSR